MTSFETHLSGYKIEEFYVDSCKVQEQINLRLPNNATIEIKQSDWILLQVT